MPHDRHHVGRAAGDRRILGAIGDDLLLLVARVAAGIVSGGPAMIANAAHDSRTRRRR